MRDDKADIFHAPIGTIRRGRIQRKAEDGETTLVCPIDFRRNSETGAMHGWAPIAGSEGDPVVYGSPEYDALVKATCKHGLVWSEC